MDQKAFSREFISSITVAYGDEPAQAPDHRIREINGRNEDINAGFGGKFVWLVPGYSTSASSAITGFDFVVQGKASPGRDDLAKGAGGDFRYLIPIIDTRTEMKVYNVGLLRLGSSLDNIPAGYSGKTIDFNKGRGKDFLYLIWKADKVQA